MNDYERLTVADALQPQNFKKGDLIIKQGDLGQTFYVIIDGICQVHKEINGERVDLVQLKAGDYFGELALLFDQPRAATVEAMTPIKTVSLDQKSFKLLLGSVDDILKRNTENYELYMKKKE
jgi:cAMP-dependent protein kinase regulator